MAYARQNWTEDEVLRLLANPVHSETGPHAHSSKHAASGELANHPMFQKARVTALIISEQQRSANAKYHVKDDHGKYPKNAKFRGANRVPRPEVGTHSVLRDDLVATALTQALNHNDMQAHLQGLDGGNDLKVHANFHTGSFGRGKIHTAANSADADFVSLFIYCKPNPSNADLPIFQTIVPSDQLKVGGNDPIIQIH